MERLTDIAFDCMTDFCDAKACVNYEVDGCCSFERYRRLAAYEDTGLEPEEIVKMGMAWEDSKRYSERLELKLKAYQDLGPIAHLRDLLRAEKDGRPVAPGEPVYVLLQDGMDFYPKTNGWYISEERIGAVALSGLYVGEPTDGVYFSYERIGETIFLTRAEAEAALVAMGKKMDDR